MKTLLQISRLYEIPKSTLVTRARTRGFEGKKILNSKYYNYDEEQNLITQEQRQYKGLVKTPCMKLVNSFRLMHPSLVAEEIAFALFINLEQVKATFKDEYLIYESKINKL